MFLSKIRNEFTSSQYYFQIMSNLFELFVSRKNIIAHK